MTFEDLMPMLMPATFAACLILERLMPAREQPHVRLWLLKGIAFFLAVGAINAIVPAIVMQQVGDYSVLHLASLGTLGGALLVVVLSDLAGYWVHRGLHTRSSSGASRTKCITRPSAWTWAARRSSIRSMCSRSRSSRLC